MQKISVGIFGPGHSLNQHDLIFYWTGLTRTGGFLGWAKSVWPFLGLSHSAVTQPDRLGPVQETDRLGLTQNLFGRLGSKVYILGLALVLFGLGRPGPMKDLVWPAWSIQNTKYR